MLGHLVNLPVLREPPDPGERRAVAAEYRLLGPFEVLVDGRLVTLAGPRQRAVLVCLLAHSNTVVPISRLVDELWGDDPPASSLNVVQGHVSSLRKELGRDAIQTRGDGYLRGSGARRSTSLASSASPPRVPRCADGRGRPLALAQGLGLGAGRPRRPRRRAGVLRPVAARLDDLRLIALERRLEAELELGRHAESWPELRTSSAAPAREGPRWLQCSRCTAAGGRPTRWPSYRSARGTWSTSSGSSRAGAAGARAGHPATGPRAPDAVRAPGHAERAARGGRSPSPSCPRARSSRSRASRAARRAASTGDRPARTVADAGELSGVSTSLRALRRSCAQRASIAVGRRSPRSCRAPTSRGWPRSRTPTSCSSTRRTSFWRMQAARPPRRRAVRRRRRRRPRNGPGRVLVPFVG